jgi:glycosyltransferase involved in cell wall biosynthesis
MKHQAAQTLIVFSHLRWDSIKQRPHHLLSRLSLKYPVLFIEEPIPYSKKEYGTAQLDKVEKHVWRLQLKVDWEDTALIHKLISKTAKSFLKDAPLLWFYSPSFIDWATNIEPALTIFDCMDELSQFKGATQKIKLQEQQLLKKVDLVFTGGKSLFESKRKHHGNVHCFPSSVERDHFAQAFKVDTPVAPELAHITGPVVGYYGAIDERIDQRLLQATAQALPHNSFVMIGPVVKITEADLAKAPNIFYLGQKPYAKLPNFLKGFDVAMMPFALNEATEFISPTKTLEYMAAHKPIVSTPITDVVRDYSEIVKISSDSATFAASIETFLRETSAEKYLRIEKERQILAQTSWDNTANTMAYLIEQELETKLSSLTLESDSISMDSLDLLPNFTSSPSLVASTNRHSL